MSFITSFRITVSGPRQQLEAFRDTARVFYPDAEEGVSFLSLNAIDPTEYPSSGLAEDNGSVWTEPHAVEYADYGDRLRYTCGFRNEEPVAWLEAAALRYPELIFDQSHLAEMIGHGQHLVTVHTIQ